MGRPETDAANVRCVAAPGLPGLSLQSLITIAVSFVPGSSLSSIHLVL